MFTILGTKEGLPSEGQMTCKGSSPMACFTWGVGRVTQTPYRWQSTSPHAGCQWPHKAQEGDKIHTLGSQCILWSTPCSRSGVDDKAKGLDESEAKNQGRGRSMLIKDIAFCYSVPLLQGQQQSPRQSRCCVAEGSRSRDVMSVYCGPSAPLP